MLSPQLFDPLILLPKLVILLFAFPLHELAHAATADWLGDPTPRSQGRLTLNPLAHLDPFGSIMLFLSFFGWAKPVMTNPRNYRNGPRAGTAIVALAGPLMNLALAVVGAIGWRIFVGIQNATDLLDVNGYSNLFQFAAIFVSINLFLMLFNLIPVGMLDGMKVLRGIAPVSWDAILNPLEQWGMIILMALIFAPTFLRINILGLVLSPPHDLLYTLLMGGIG